MARFFLGLKEGGDIRVRSLIQEEDSNIHAPFKTLIPKGATFLGLSYERLTELATAPGWIDTRDDGTAIGP
ncbi:hypothetical protein [Methylomagnum ishizawai]|uniref:hypothetical protein n=1 Tax=Methylomagnum ishizawai TaxID=1760988 RepID=UPI001C33F0A5|nr:hypothetical protein [Methylomagnum ishizawai]BBL73665.1 hypothetical protein MishRS11D_07630 [Methylomagnum ishizawai]